LAKNDKLKKKNKILGRPLEPLLTLVFQKENLAMKSTVGLSVLKTAVLHKPRGGGMRAWQGLTTDVHQYVADFARHNHFEEQQTTVSSLLSFSLARLV